MAALAWQPAAARGAPQNLLMLLLAGAAANGICAVLVRRWPGERVASIGAALCQMLFAIACMYLFGNHPAIAFYGYASLVIISLNEDTIALIAACGTACCYVLVTGSTTVLPYALRHMAAKQRTWGEVVSLLLCTALLCYVISERRQEAAEQAADREIIRATLYRAFRDACTGLPNRAALQNSLRERLHPGETVTCLWMEFEGIFGTDTGIGIEEIEALVRSVATRLQQAVEPGDLLGRVGNDKFCVLSYSPRTRTQLTACAERIVQSVSRPHRIASRTADLSVNVGIASMSIGVSDLDALLMTADRAMRVAKSEERNHFRFAEDLSTAADQRNQVLAQKLQKALVHGGLRLVYQPFSMPTGR